MLERVWGEVNMKAVFTPLSKTLRKKQTPWESKLWKHLRRKNIQGLKFKRQVPIGNYIVDFCCQSKKLIIELDGGQHMSNRFQDIERDRYLRTKGYNILRFWNNEVDSNLEGVLEKIYKSLITSL